MVNEKYALTSTNAQIMSDYKSDLESLKSAMKAKDKEDKIILEKITEEKRQKEIMYYNLSKEHEKVKSLMEKEISQLKLNEKKLIDEMHKNLDKEQ